MSAGSGVSDWSQESNIHGNQAVGRGFLSAMYNQVTVNFVLVVLDDRAGLSVRALQG